MLSVSGRNLWIRLATKKLLDQSFPSFPSMSISSLSGLSKYDVDVILDVIVLEARVVILAAFKNVVRIDEAVVVDVHVLLRSRLSCPSQKVEVARRRLRLTSQRIHTSMTLRSLHTRQWLGTLWVCLLEHHLGQQLGGARSPSVQPTQQQPIRGAFRALLSLAKTDVAAAEETAAAGIVEDAVGKELPAGTNPGNVGTLVVPQSPSLNQILQARTFFASGT